MLAAGLSVRAISAEADIPVGAVHRAKRQLEKDLAHGRQNAAAIAQQLPTSYVVKQDIGGVPHDVRRLTVAVYEQFVESAIGRGLLGRADRDNPWAVVSALFAGMFDDHTIEWLNKRGYLTWGRHRQARGNHRRRQCSDRTASLKYINFRRWGAGMSNHVAHRLAPDLTSVLGVKLTYGGRHGNDVNDPNATLAKRLQRDSLSHNDALS